MICNITTAGTVRGRVLSEARPRSVASHSSWRAHGRTQTQGRELREMTTDVIQMAKTRSKRAPQHGRRSLPVSTDSTALREPSAFL